MPCIWVYMAPDGKFQMKHFFNSLGVLICGGLEHLWNPPKPQYDWIMEIMYYYFSRKTRTVSMNWVSPRVGSRFLLKVVNLRLVTPTLLSFPFGLAPLVSAAHAEFKVEWGVRTSWPLPDFASGYIRHHAFKCTRYRARHPRN